MTLPRYFFIGIYAGHLTLLTLSIMNYHAQEFSINQFQGKFFYHQVLTSCIEQADKFVLSVINI